MDASLLIQECLNDGINLFLSQEGGLRFSSSSGRFPKSIKEQLQLHKAEIVQYLKKPTNSNQTNATNKPSNQSQATPQTSLTKQDWLHPFNTLLAMPKPKFIGEGRWEKIKLWACILSDVQKPYLEDFAKHDWSLKDIFGCHVTNIEGGHLQMGFLLIVTSPLDERSKGLTIHEVLEDRIVLLRADGYYKNYFKQFKEIPLQSTLLDLTLN